MTLDEYIDSIKDKSIAVLGIGVSNEPLLELLLHKGIKVTACDKHSEAELGDKAGKLRTMGAVLRLGEGYLEDLNQELIFRTPGLMPFDRHLVDAQARGSVVTSEMEVFLSLCPCKVIAVTGSDGKTTTSTIIAELLKAAGHRVHLGGNIGHPLLCETPQIEKDDICVLELSSFQLHSMSCRPDVAVITNLSPNHLDKHLDLQDYADAKRSIFQRQGPKDRLVLNLDDAYSPYYASFAKSRISLFSDRNRVSDGAELIDGVIYRVNEGERRAVMKAEDILLPGEHNLLNYLAAFAATEGLVSDEVCAEVAAGFAGVEHRLETVRVLRGVTYINDSIGTSPTRTAAGLRALKTRPIVIAGGYDKHIPFDGLGDDLCLHAKSVFLTGDTSEKIKTAIYASRHFAESGLRVSLVEDFREAVLAASASAGEGDIVLLSPACAAFDRFDNFAQRGKYFKEIVMELQ